MAIGLAGAIGGFAQGAAQGLKLRSDLDDAEERRKLMKEQGAREERRLVLQEQEAGRAEKKFGYDIKTLERQSKAADLEDQARDMFLQADGIINGTASQSQAAQQPTQGIATPTGQTASIPAQTVPNQTAIAPPASAQPAPAAQPDAGAQGGPPKNNPFVTYATGADLDKAYDLKAKALQLSLAAKGDLKGAMEVPLEMKKLRDANWSESVGTSLAAMAGGAPGAREAFAKVYGLVNDGYELDTKSGKFDPDKGWTGLVRVNQKTGEREAFDLSPTQAVVIANKFKDPAATIQYVIENRNKDIELGLKKRQVGAQEEQARAETTKAGASVISAKANAAEAASKGKYYDAYAGYLDRKGIEEADASKQKASVEAAARMFPLVGKEIKQEELMLMEKNDRLDILKRKRDDEMMFDKTLDLAGLNPKVDVRTLAQLARQKTVDAQKDSDGRVFTMVNGKKIYLQ